MNIIRLLFIVCFAGVAASGCQSLSYPDAVISGASSTDVSGPNISNQKPPGTGRTQTKALLPASAPVDPVYTALGGNKAQAITTPLTKTAGAPLYYSNNVSGSPNPVQAAIQALTECEQARASRPVATSACELRRRNDTLIHSTQELTNNLQPDREAFIWRIEPPIESGPAGENDPATLYLAGSIHLLKPTLEAPPSYTEAFNGASTLVLEVAQSTLNAEKTQLALKRYGVLPEGIQQSDLFTPDEVQQIERYVTGLGIPLAITTNLKPAMLLLQAAALEYIATGYLAQHGVDTLFEANKGNRKVVALETIDEQLAAATALPLDLQAELLLETLAVADDVSEEIGTLVHSWLSGDAEALQRSFSAETESPAVRGWLDDLLAKRNVAMALGLSELLKGAAQQDRIFALVGAAHLVGPGSVIELLEAAGFSTQRLPHNSLQTTR